jgi:hypothetical protein
MADVQFMDLGNALRNVGQIRNMEMQQQEFADQRALRQRRQGLAPDVQAAIGGDPEAVKRIAGVDPDYAMKLAPLMATLDEKKQQVLKRAADFTTQAGMGVLNAPPELRPQAYAAAVAEAQRMGIPTESWPKEWGPQTEGWLHFNVKKAIPVATWFAENERTAREGAKNADVLMSADGTITRPGGGGVSPYNIGNVRPVGGGSTSGFQQPASLDDGIRLAVNNVQAYPAKFNGGQPMTLLQIGERWAPRGDGRNDPAQWARNVATIGGLPVDQPLDLSNPQVQAAFARGVHGAEHGAQAVQAPEVYVRALGGGAAPAAPRPGFSPSPVPAQNVAGGLPQMPQGDNVTTGAPNTPPQPKPANAYTDILSKLPPGAQLLLDPTTRMPRYDKDGRVAVQYPDGSRNFIEIPKPGKGGEAGPFSGTGMDQQAMNILLQPDKFDPSTPTYAAAYAHMSRPRTTMDAEGRVVTVQPMDMSMFPKPMVGRGGQPTGPAPLPEGAVQQDIPGGGTVTVTPSIADKGPTQKEQADLRTARAEADKITAAAQRYMDEWKKATPADRAKALTGANTPLNTAYNNFALLAKGDALYNLGVLNGPDLDIIRRTIADPSTMKSGMVSEADVNNSVEQVLGVLRKGIEAREKQLQGAKGGQGGAPKPGAADQGKLLFEARDALKRGADPEKVKARLREQGVDPAGL